MIGIQACWNRVIYLPKHEGGDRLPHPDSYGPESVEGLSQGQSQLLKNFHTKVSSALGGKSTLFSLINIIIKISNEGTKLYEIAF